MDAADYARISSRADVMRRPDIRATIVRLAPTRPDLASRWEILLQSPPIPKPDLHGGGQDTDRFIVDLSAKEFEDIVEEMTNIETSAAQEPTTPSALLSTASTLLDKWNAAQRTRSDAA